MKPTLVAGAAGTASITVDAPRTIDFMSEEARVYATRMLVRDIEMATRAFLLGHLDAGVDAICRAKHARFVVDVATTKQRLAAKAQKAGLKAA